jgi:DNA-binding XRE family transcriptional regulator
MNIKTARHKLRISQARLARLSGVSRFKICLHERDDQVLNQVDLARIEQALQGEARRLAEILAYMASGPTAA